MKKGFGNTATRSAVVFIFLASIPFVSFAGPTIRVSAAVADAETSAVAAFVQDFLTTLERGVQIAKNSFRSSFSATATISRTSVMVVPATESVTTFSRPTINIWGNTKPGVTLPPTTPPTNPPAEQDPPTVPPPTPPVTTTPPPVTTTPPSSTTTPPTGTTTPPTTSCSAQESALTQDGVTVACLSRGTLDTLEARQYGYPSELPPRVILKNGNERTYLLTTSFSNVCRSTANYLNQSIYFSDCDTVLMEDLMTGVSPTGEALYEDDADDEAPWRRSYAGILAAVSSKDKVVGVVHGENQNIRRGSDTYLNTIKQNVDSNCVAGYDEDGVWQNCWTQFASFANIVWWEKNDFLNGGTPHDIGPVLWNHRPYAEDGGGPYHPTLFKDDSYFYLYASISPSWGWGCITAARASIKGNGLPSKFLTLAADGTFSQAARPSGYSIASIRDFYDSTVAEPACLFDATYSGTWFSVARVDGTPYYLSLEEQYIPDPNTARIVLRISDDPGNWKNSTPVVLEQKPGWWGVLDLTYPMFSDSGATQLGVIAPSSFFVIGNAANRGFGIHALPLSLRIL